MWQLIEKKARIVKIPIKSVNVIIYVFFLIHSTAPITQKKYIYFLVTRQRQAGTARTQLNPNTNTGRSGAFPDGNLFVQVNTRDCRLSAYVRGHRSHQLLRCRRRRRLEQHKCTRLSTDYYLSWQAGEVEAVARRVVFRLGCWVVAGSWLTQSARSCLWSRLASYSASPLIQVTCHVHVLGTN